MVRKTETLARIPLFRSLAADALERLDTQCAWRRAKAKERILGYKDEGADIYFVVQGHVRVVIQANSGRDSILRDIRDGGYFGELAALDGMPRSAEIVAIADSVVAKMPPLVFRDVLRRQPDVCDQLLSLLASQIRMLANRVNELGTLDVRTRIYAELLRLSRPAPANSRHAVISPPPTAAELAARVSSRREAVSRELNSLERAGLLERRRGALVLLDPERLTTLVAQFDE
jgi:CRP-like cAMP-binding protein